MALVQFSLPIDLPPLELSGAVVKDAGSTLSPSRHQVEEPLQDETTVRKEEHAKNSKIIYQVAIKKMPDGEKTAWKNETKALKMMKLLPGALRIYGQFAYEKSVYIVTEFVQGRQLARVLQDVKVSAGKIASRLGWYGIKGFSEPVVRRHVVDMIIVLEFLEENNYIHADWKAGNMVLGINGRIMVGSGGMGKVEKD